MSALPRHPLDYDFTLRRLSVDGVELAYVDEGPAGSTDAPVVMVHGIGATLDHWALVIPRIAQTRRVIALDLPGFGMSAKPDRRYDPEAFASTIARFLALLGVDHFVLVGHSMGGAIAAELTLSDPSRIERLVLVDAAGMTRLPQRLLDFLSREFERSIDARRIVLPERVVRVMARMMFHDTPPPPFAARNAERIMASMGEPDWPERVRSFVRSATGLSRSTVRDRLAEISVPTLIVWGEHDRVLPVRHGRALAAGIRGSRLVTFPRTGHCPQIERPDTFVSLVREFLGPGGVR